jgi:hypothetical protein
VVIPPSGITGIFEISILNEVPHPGHLTFILSTYVKGVTKTIFQFQALIDT